MGAGHSLELKTQKISSNSPAVRAYATITVTRPRNDTKAEACRVRCTLFFSDAGQPFVPVKTFSETTGWMVGAQVVGFSKDHSKLAADFWWAAGDYTGHRPVIYDIGSKRVLFRELDEQITKRLPSCDYFQVFSGVANSGEAIIHVPKSTYVDEGCPDQGDWLFNVGRGTVRRRASSRPTPTS